MNPMRFVTSLFLSLVVFLFFILLCLPTVLSTNWGCKGLIAVVNHYIDGSIEIQHLDLHWGKGQHIQGFLWKDGRNQTMMEFDEFDTQLPLWQLLFKDIRPGQTNIRNLNLLLDHSNFETTIPIRFSNINLNMNLFTPDEPVSFRLDGTSHQGDINGHFNLSLFLPAFDIDRWNESGKKIKDEIAFQASKTLLAEGEIVDFPIETLNFLFSSKKVTNNEPFTKVLGDRLNLKIKKETLSENVASFVLTASTPLLPEDITGAFNILLPLKADHYSFNSELQLPSKVFDLFLGSSTQFKEMLGNRLVILAKLEGNLRDKMQGDIKIQSDTLAPIPIQIAVEKGLIKSDIAISNLNFPLSDELGAIQITDAHIEVLGGLHSDWKAKLFANLDLKQHSTSIDLFGGPAVLTAETSFGANSFIKAKLESTNLSFLAEGILTHEKQLLFKKPITLDFLLTEQVFKALELNSTSLFNLNHPSKIMMETESFNLNLNSAELKDFVVRGCITANQMSFQDAYGTNAYFKQISVPWEINAPLNRIQIEAQGTASTDSISKESPLLAKIIVNDWLEKGKLNLKELNIEIYASLFAVPVEFLNTFLSEHNLEPLMGTSVDVQLKASADWETKAPRYLEIDIDSELLHIRTRLLMDQKVVFPRPDKIPAEFRWTLTPEGYLTLQKMFPESINNETRLVSPVTITGTVFELNFPVDDVKNGLIQMELKSTGSHWENSQGDALPSLYLNASLNGEQIGDQLDFSLQVFSSESEPSIFNIFGNIKDLSEISLKSNLRKFPVKIVDRFLFIDTDIRKNLHALLGEHVDGELSLKLKEKDGEIAGSIHSARSKGSWNAKLDNGILTLTQPLEYEILMTPEIVLDLFGTKTAVLSEIISSEQPIRLTIDPKEFRLPLFPLNLKEANIDKGTVQLGKIHCHNKGELKKILSLLSTIKDEQIVIWFTPLYFQLVKDKVTIHRFDLLVANQFPIAFWGNATLSSKKIDMTVGLSAQALRSAFGLSGLPKKYLLTVPVNGKEGHIKIDYAKATARISALIAKQQENPKAKLLGFILELAASDENSNPPESTTEPLPWADQFESESQTKSAPSNQQSKSKHHSEKSDVDAVIKEIGKGAASLLDKLLK